VAAAFFVRGLASLALALVSVFFAAGAFLAALVALVAAAVFFVVALGAAAFLVVVVFGLGFSSAFSTFSVFSDFDFVSFLAAVVVVAGVVFFSVAGLASFFASLTGPEGPLGWTKSPFLTPWVMASLKYLSKSPARSAEIWLFARTYFLRACRLAKYC